MEVKLLIRVAFLNQTNACTLQIVIKSDDVSKELGGEVVVLDSEAETATVKLEGATLKKGTALLTINFTGTLNTNMAGFYREFHSVPAGWFEVSCHHGF